MDKGIFQKVRLNNGYAVPVFAACPDLPGATDAPTWLEDWQAQNPGQKPFQKEIEQLLGLGCRSFDSGFRYGTENVLGEVFRTCGIPREELFFTTKIYHDMHGYDNTLRYVEDVLNRTGLDYIDTLLIHCPITYRGLYPDTWRAMERVYRQGMVKSIGVSNFTVQHFYDLAAVSDIVPAINQREQHPFYIQPNLLAYERHNGIVAQSYSPLGHGKYARDPRLAWIAQQHGKSIAQVILRWHVQSGFMLVTRSANEQRIRENTEIFDFTLSVKEMAFIDSLNHGTRIWHDAVRFPGSCFYNPAEETLTQNIKTVIAGLSVSKEERERIWLEAEKLLDSRDVDGTSDYVIYCFKRVLARYGKTSDAPALALAETEPVAAEMVDWILSQAQDGEGK